ncbi:MAG: hypothetical protein AAFY35_05450 [Pseudomonadota bacterium]
MRIDLALRTAAVARNMRVQWSFATHCNAFVRHILSRGRHSPRLLDRGTDESLLWSPKPPMLRLCPRSAFGCDTLDKAPYGLEGFILIA